MSDHPTLPTNSPSKSLFERLSASRGKCLDQQKWKDNDDPAQNFKQAVSKVEHFLFRLQEFSVGYDFGDGDFNARDFAKDLGSNDKTLITYVEWLVVEELEDWLEAAKTDRNAYDTLLFSAGHLLRNGYQLPDDLASFIGEHLTETVAPPKLEARRP